MEGVFLLPFLPLPTFLLFLPSHTIFFRPPPLSLEVGPLKPARGYGERCKLPQRGTQQSPDRKQFCCTLELSCGNHFEYYEVHVLQ